MHYAKIISQYRNKSNLRDCNINRGISLLKIKRKVITWNILNRIQVLAGHIYLCRFKTEISTCEMIFFPRHIQNLWTTDAILHRSYRSSQGVRSHEPEGPVLTAKNRMVVPLTHSYSAFTPFFMAASAI